MTLIENSDLRSQRILLRQDSAGSSRSGTGKSAYDEMCEKFRKDSEIQWQEWVKRGGNAEATYGKEIEEQVKKDVEDAVSSGKK